MGPTRLYGAEIKGLIAAISENSPMRFIDLKEAAKGRPTPYTESCQIGITGNGTVLNPDLILGGDRKAIEDFQTQRIRLFSSVEELQERLDQLIALRKNLVDAAEEEERVREKALRREKEEQERTRASRRKAGVCQYCGGSFGGLFRKKCTQCGKPKDY